MINIINSIIDRVMQVVVHCKYEKTILMTDEKFEFCVRQYLFTDKDVDRM
jgi:hypothetical protein